MNKLSVIITSNKEERLGEIQSMLITLAYQETRHPLQVIFITEGSAKLYERIASVDYGYAKNALTLCQAPQGAGLAGARNIGIKEATGDVIAFLDDDVLPNAYWARAMMEAYYDGCPIGIAGQALPLWTKESMDWLPKELDWLISCTRWTGWTEPRRVATAWGMNMSFRREAFERCGLFNEDTGYHKGFVAEDIEFSHRVRKITGQSIWFYPQAIVYHRVYPYRLTPKYIKERSIWIGQTHRMARELYPEDKLEQNDAGLIKRILKRMPTMTPKQLTLTLRVLFWVAYGYYVKGAGI